jgi:hypothetical protein
MRFRQNKKQNKKEQKQNKKEQNQKNPKKDKKTSFFVRGISSIQQKVIC